MSVEQSFGFGQGGGMQVVRGGRVVHTSTIGGSEMAQEPLQVRAESLAQRFNMSSTDLFDFLRKFEPAAREAILILLESTGWFTPQIQEQVVAQHRLPVMTNDPAGVEQTARTVGANGQVLLLLIQQLGPIAAQLLLQLLKNITPPAPAPG